MQIEVLELERSLLRKGFVKDATHHNIFRHKYGDKFTGVLTKTSHSAKTYAGDLIGKVKRQMKFNSPKELFAFVACTISLDQYNDILIQKNVFPR